MIYYYVLHVHFSLLAAKGIRLLKEDINLAGNHS